MHHEMKHILKTKTVSAAAAAFAGMTCKTMTPLTMEASAGKGGGAGLKSMELAAGAVSPARVLRGNQLQ
jgi:hypothetical protein